MTNGKSLFVCINDHGTLTQMKQEPKCLDLTAGAFRATRQQPQPDAGHIIAGNKRLSHVASSASFFSSSGRWPWPGFSTAGRCDPRTGS
ncbi:hypothetical protein [Streptomyces sp. NPDC002078]